MVRQVMVLSVMALLSLPLTIDAGERPVLAVFNIEFKGVKLTRLERDGLSEYLTTRVARGNKYQVIPRDQIRQRLLKQKADSYKKCFDQSCQVELGRELAAEKAMSAKVFRLGKQCTLNLAIYDLKKATPEVASTGKGGCKVDALIKVIDQALGGSHLTATTEPKGGKNGAECSSPEACFKLAKDYAAGVVKKKNIPKAVTLFDRACMDGHWSSCVTSANYYFDGKGVAQDHEKAALLNARACQKGFDFISVIACQKVIFMYEKGVGVKKSPEKVKAYENRLNVLVKILEAKGKGK